VLQRNIEQVVREAMTDTPVVLLNGARQTGKTTLAQAMTRGISARYFTLDDATTLALAVSDPTGFVGALAGLVVLDEIQKAPDLFSAIKVAVDKDRRPGRFLLTGSANVMTLPRLSDSLAGRMQVVPLFPFSAGELAGVREDWLARIFDGTIAKTKPASAALDLPSRLATGGYPEATQRRREDRRATWFASYISTLLGRDVRDLAQVEALHALPNLLKLFAARTSGLLNLADVGRDAGLPHSTLTRYLVLLETLFLVHRLPAWSPNLGKRLVKAPKLHLLDTGLACHLLGADARRLAGDPMLLGRMLETFVVSELTKQASWSDQRVELYHLRTAAGSEVDVILERSDGSVAALEVKASATVTASDFAALQTLRDGLGPHFCAGIVLCLGQEVIPFGDRLWVVPLSALWSGSTQGD
jgi:uncharacterized protein